MKMIVAAVLAMFSLAFSDAAYAAVKPVDAERAAQVYAPLNLQTACGQFWEELVTGGQTQGDVCFVKFAPYWRVSYLAIGKDVLVNWGDEPLKSIPASKLGEVRWFSIWLTLYDGAGRAVGSGSAGVANPAENPIRIAIKPYWVVEEIPFLPPPGTDVTKLELVLDDGGVVMYDSFGQRFVVAVDPLRVTPYTVFAAGQPIAFGVADPIRDRKREEQVVFNLKLEGGVYELPDQENFRFSSTVLEAWLDGVCPTDDPCGAVFYTDLRGAAFAVQTAGLQGYLEIRRWVPGGEMPIIVATYWDPKNDGRYLYVPAGYGLVVVKFVGQMDAAHGAADDFSFYFWRFGGAGGGSAAGGGGKG